MRALLLFHFRVGARLALRYFAPVVALPLLALGLTDNPDGALRELADQFFGSSAGSHAWLICCGIGWMFVSWAVPRMTRGLRSWFSHLPATTSQHRRALLFALASLQLPVIIALLLLLILYHQGQAANLPVIFARIVFVAFWPALTMLPVERKRVLWILSFFVLSFLWMQDWRSLLIIPVFVCMEAIAGPIAIPHKRSAFESRGARLLWFRISMRALRWKSLTPIITGILIAIAGRLFLANNDLPASVVHRATQAAGMLSSMACAVSMERLLRSMRPAWPMARSFPERAMTRIFQDATFLILAMLPALVVLVTADLRGTLPAVFLSPFIAGVVLWLAPSNQAANKNGDSGAVVVLACSALICALLPAFSFLCAALTPFVFHFAAIADQKRKVSRFQEFQHLAAGDSISWSGE